MEGFVTDIASGVLANLASDAIQYAVGEFKRPSVPTNSAPKDYLPFDSRKKVIDRIVKALKDPDIGIIGMYGPAGVGKTTLVRAVARQVEEANLFAPVVVATVTETPKVEEIQDLIADSLGLSLAEKRIPIRARRLSEKLKNEKKILVVLDDLWDELNLEEVGIRFGDQHKGCKILLTSRNRHVLTNKKDADKVFPITDLREYEAWDLFREMAANYFENQELRSTAIEVAKTCAGLPLAIVTVARALKGKELAEWRNALLRLERPSPENFTGISKKVNSAIQLSYDMLEREELRKTIRLSCLLGRNAHIEELLRYAIGLRLFSGVNTVEQTRNRALTVVSKLKTSCLLLDDGDNDGCLVMHDLVWDFALAIAKRYNHAFVLRQEDVFEGWPDEEEMQNFSMICLRSAGIKKLPHELECPQLTLFSMASGGWSSYVEMPPSFFEKTKNIKVLDLRWMDFSSSPSSVSLPTSLRTLPTMV